MKSYEAINWYEKDTDEVYDYLFEELEENEQYPFFSWLTQHFPDLEIDWLETFEDLKEALILNEQIDEVLSFVAWYRQKYPEDYSERYEFIEKDLCDYFFFKKDINRLQERIAFIQQHPVPAIDTLTVRLLFQLIYHGYYDLAVSYAEAVWKPVDESEELIGFAAYPFIHTIYVSQLQIYHEAHLNGINLDENKLFTQMVSMGYSEDRAIFNEVMRALKGDFSREEVEESINNGKDGHMLALNIHFLKYMLHTYQLPFVFSEWIWDFISTTEIFGKQKGVENWFYIEAITLDKYIAKKYDAFMGSNELEVFGKVWGLDFVFDFFHQRNLLSTQHYTNGIENLAYFRNELMRIANESLWQMTFVFEWPRTDTVVVDPSEKLLFSQTFGKYPSEAREIVGRYVSMYQTPFRIRKELKLNDARKNKPTSIWSEYASYVKEEPKVGRNDLCPCGSGKKFKKCCMDT
ncbi:MAG: SEC-C domain-containing protein [Lunatimonas sp.]|uniref:YecA family protein n=1 Tax=Lunatimonas sp. TaxID=2060141 RepID=UPI00263ADF08|nr:SEC-C metal-binding domain-containing protein [Lunatimonas sp.]MCC5939112.1 SEC-C domain-containing protein [Lunatimonas sp.]